MIDPKQKRYAVGQHSHDQIAHKQTQPAARERNYRPRLLGRWFFKDCLSWCG